MKKILGMLAVAAMTIVACGEKDSGNEQDPADYNYTTPRLEAPANQEEHFGLTVDETRPQDGMLTPEGKEAKITELTIPPGKTGTVLFNDGRPPREFSFEVVYGKAPTGVTILPDGLFKRIEMSSIDGENAVLTVKTLDDQVVTIYGSLNEEPPYTSYRQDVCRTWEIEETILAVAVEGKSIVGLGGRFEGCRLSEISEKLSEKGVDVDILSRDYDIKKIMTDPCGKFGIFFQGRDPYYGDYSLKGINFTYSFRFYEEDDDTNPVIAGSAIGKLWAAGGYGRLNIKSDMKDSSGKKYTVDITLKMKTAQ